MSMEKILISSSLLVPLIFISWWFYNLIKSTAPIKKNIVKKENEIKNDFGDKYLLIGWFIGVIIFVCIWIYAFVSWGFLIGLAIGWLPAIIGGIISGLIWPLIIVFLIIIFIVIFF